MSRVGHFGTVLWATYVPLLSALLLALVAVPRPASADSGAALVVSTFDTDEPAAPGATLSHTVRVSNRGAEPLTVQVTPHAVDLLDDGETHFEEAADPMWAGAMTLSESELTVPAGSWRDVVVRVTIPATTPPDDYITGVLVAPVPAVDGPMRVVNAIGALIPISVMGDRVRSLELVDHALPPFVIGDQVTGTVRVKDTGTTLVSPWLEAGVVDCLRGSQVADLQIHDQTRVGPGASRDLSYTWHAGVVAGKFRVPVRIFYNRDDNTSAELDLEEEVWLIHPAVLMGSAVLVAVLTAGAVALSRRKGGHWWPPFGRWWRLEQLSAPHG